MKKTVYLFLLSLLSLTSNATITEVQYLSGTDKDHTVTWDFFCTKGMNSGKWTTIQVPSQWEQQGFGGYNYGQGDPINDEKGLYKYQFEVPKVWKNKKVYLVFEGSMTDTEVKINGKIAGKTHQGSFYQFRYDISGLLKFGSKNLLEATVSKESSDSSVNRAERRGDYWVFGGIFRPVYLEALPKEFLNRVAIDAKADGSFSMDVFLSGISKAIAIEAQIQTTDGKAFGAPMTASVTKKMETLKLNGLFSNPALWNPESPNLYEVVVRLKDKKNTIHQIKQRFGFRTVEVRQNDGIYVNNQKILFRGVCRHTFWPESARCSSKELSISDVNNIKDMNMNAVRMSHYPPDQHFLDVCDSLGLFVLNELAGWHAYYSTEIGKRLVKQMVERDVNHPSIVIWDNGNEGGFNKELRTEFAKYDPQNRQIIEPWAKLNGMDTKHYPGYKYVENALNNGKMIYYPTEFLHGLYDGGHGAGLDDYWKLMTSKPLSAGGFLWVYADEGIVRKDWKDSIDTHGNNAPDGIVGPFHEKEGSFFTIKEIWSPVQVDKTVLNQPFDGNIPVTNRYLYTNLNRCTFTGELVKYSGTFPQMDKIKKDVVIQTPDIKSGDNGFLKAILPTNLTDYDVFYLTAIDPSGREIYTWSWNLTSPEKLSSRISPTCKDKVSGREEGNFILLACGKTKVKIDKTNGLLTEVQAGEQKISFSNGPVFIGDTLNFKGIKHYASGNTYVVEVLYNQSPERFLRWTMLENGCLQLDYQYHPVGKMDFAGITFDYPETLVTGAVLLANGPYHVWKNRLKGVEFDLYTKKYNNTITGQTWEYPEFKGYYSNFYGVEIQTKELPFSILSATPNLFLHLFTPSPPKHIKGSVNPPFPKGTISILNGISAIGTKFSKPEQEGPQSQKNEFSPSDLPLKGSLIFKFGK